MVNVLEAFKNICLQQRATATMQSHENFRETLVKLFQEASNDELDNLAIDIEEAA